MENPDWLEDVVYQRLIKARKRYEKEKHKENYLCEIDNILFKYKETIIRWIKEIDMS